MAAARGSFARFAAPVTSCRACTPSSTLFRWSAPRRAKRVTPASRASPAPIGDRPSTEARASEAGACAVVGLGPPSPAIPDPTEYLSTSALAMHPPPSLLFVGTDGTEPLPYEYRLSRRISWVVARQARSLCPTTVASPSLVCSLFASFAFSKPIDPHPSGR